MPGSASINIEGEDAHEIRDSMELASPTEGEQIQMFNKRPTSATVNELESELVKQ